MANRIPDGDLEAAMEKAGLGQRTRDKMRKANQQPVQTSGHGAPSEDRVSLGGI